jgi:hypothetical protein
MWKLASRQNLAIATAAGTASDGLLAPELWLEYVNKSLGRAKNRWEDDVKSDITKMKIANWRDCIKNRPKWKKIPWEGQNFSEVVAPKEEEEEEDR